METEEWSAEDQDWASRYRIAMKGRHVPASSLAERERELRQAIHAAETPAADLFGDARGLAAEDAVELATAEEAVRASLGGGLRPLLKEIGGTLTGIAAVSALLTAVRQGWTVDVVGAHALVAGGLVAAVVGGIIARALFTAGRAAYAVSALVASGTVVASALAWAVELGSEPVAASNIPVPLFALAILCPGILLLIASSRMRQQELRRIWRNDQWLRSFRGGLRARLMSPAAARGHMVEIQQAVELSGRPAYEEFGDPLALAREIAAADRRARTRLWWTAVIVGSGWPLAIATFLLVDRIWGALTIPAALFLALGAAVTLSTAWANRPWTERR